MIDTLGIENTKIQVVPTRTSTAMAPDRSLSPVVGCYTRRMDGGEECFGDPRQKTHGPRHSLEASWVIRTTVTAGGFPVLRTIGGSTGAAPVLCGASLYKTPKAGRSLSFAAEPGEPASQHPAAWSAKQIRACKRMQPRIRTQLLLLLGSSAYRFVSLCSLLHVFASTDLSADVRGATI